MMNNLNLLAEYATNIKDNNDGLIKAIFKKDIGKVKEFVEKGAYINQESNGWTPLIIAISKGNLDIVQYLIGRGANLDKATTRGYTPLMMATDTCNKYIVSSYIILKYLLSKGVDVNKKDENGITALDIACDINNINVVKCLVEKGAKIDIESKSGKELILRTYKRGNRDIVDYLIDEVLKDSKELKFSDINFLLQYRSKPKTPYEMLVMNEKRLRDEEHKQQTKTVKVKNLERENKKIRKNDKRII